MPPVALILFRSGLPVDLTRPVLHGDRTAIHETSGVKCLPRAWSENYGRKFLPILALDQHQATGLVNSHLVGVREEQVSGTVRSADWTVRPR